MKKIFLGLIILVIGIIIGFLVVKFFLVKKQSPTPTIGPNQETSRQLKITNQLNKNFNWEDNKEYLIEEIKKEFPTIDPKNLNLSEEARDDINNDNVPEVLIDLGVGGVAVENYIFITFKNNLPTLLKFKTKEGKIESLAFNEGTGGAGRYGSSIGILPKENVIYQGMFSAYNEEDDFCSVDAFKYNRNQDLYEYNQELSLKLTANYCQDVCSQVKDEQELKSYFQRICSGYWQ